MVLQLILGNKIKTRGVLRPIDPEVYVPGNQALVLVCLCSITVSNWSCLWYCSDGYHTSIWYQGNGEG